MPDDALPRAGAVAPAGTWPAEAAIAAVTLTYAARTLRRRRLVADDGTAVLLELPRAVTLCDGDGLSLDTGDWLVVRAAAEPVLEAEAGDARTLARLAWHVGNRHTPVEVLAGALRLQADTVLETMLAGLGARVVHREAPFQPEPGAYGHGHGHGGAP